LLAVFFNCTFMVFGSTFDWVENIHHLIEHWESATPHQEGGDMSLHTSNMTTEAMDL